MARILGQPQAEGRLESPPLAPIKGRHTPAIGAAAAPTLHLNQQQSLWFRDQQIDLTPAAAPLTCDDPPARSKQQALGPLFGPITPAALIRFSHLPDPARCAVLP
jgi:hypothetical protein